MACDFSKIDPGPGWIRTPEAVELSGLSGASLDGLARIDRHTHQQHGRLNTMLVLTRQKDEQVVVGNQVLIQVIEIRGDKVRLGIDAPRSVSVHRAEVQEAINDNLRQMGTQVKPAVTLLTKPPVEAAGHQPIDRLRTRNARLLAFLKRVRRELKQQLFVSQSLANSLKTRAEQSEAALLRIIDHVTTHGSIDKDHLLLSDILVAKRDQQGQPNG